MRLKEWFSWHFPELSKIVTDNNIFSKVVHRLGNRDEATDEIKDELTEIVHDEDKAQ
jgi:nucleolar protein 56